MFVIRVSWGNWRRKASSKRKPIAIVLALRMNQAEPATEAVNSPTTAHTTRTVLLQRNIKYIAENLF